MLKSGLLRTALVLGLALVWPGYALAQAGPGASPAAAQQFSTLEEIYTVRNIAVDEKADSASAAREIALRAGRRMAFSRLTRRIVAPQDISRIGFQADEALTDLIADFEVASEKTRGQRYLAQLTMRFDPEKVRALMRRGGIRHSETSAPAVLVLPVYDGPEGRLLWEANGWRDALNAAILQTGAADDRLAPLMLPPGDSEDAAALSADQAVQGDMQYLGIVMRRHGAAAILLMHAAQSPSPGAAGGLAFDISLRRLGADEENLRIERFEGQPGEQAAMVLQRASWTLVQGIEEAWISETALDFAQQALLEVTAQLASLQEWLAIQKRLNETPMIQRVDLRGLSVQGALINLHYAGTPEKLAAALSQHGLDLTQTAGHWQLR